MQIKPKVLMEKEKTIYNTPTKIVIIIADPIGILKLSSSGSGKVSKSIADKAPKPEM